MYIDPWLVLEQHNQHDAISLGTPVRKTQNVRFRTCNPKRAAPLPKPRPIQIPICIYCPRVNASVWSGGPLLRKYVRLSKKETNDYGPMGYCWTLFSHSGNAFVHCLCLSYGLWGATGCVFLALENAFGMFLCSMAFFCLCMRKFQKRI